MKKLFLKFWNNNNISEQEFLSYREYRKENPKAEILPPLGIRDLVIVLIITIILIIVIV